MSGKIYSYANNWRVKRVEAAAAYSGAKVEEAIIDMAQTKEPEFLAKFPAGCVPAFESEDGLTITESAAITEYVAKNGPTPFWPTDKHDAAKVASYICIVDQEIAARVQLANGMIAGYIPYNKPVYQNLIDKAVSRLAAIDGELKKRTFLVGERITVADVTLASALYTGFQGHLDAPIRAKIPNVVRHFNTIVNQPKLKSIFGEVKFSETAPQYQPPKKETKVADKPKAEAAPKAPKAKKAAEEEDDDEPAVPAEPKAKNPLDDLPKSDFKLDDWKRTYSNEDTRSVALPWFYEHFDKEGFSIWRVDYKYNDELTQVFMSSNLVGGFFARLEASRKYAFGSMGVFGKANDSIISGVVVVRGKDFKPVMDVAPDWESYSFTPLDVSKEEDKKFFEGAMAWDLEIDGKPFADGKVFK